jgi:hypothetical protein
MAVAVIVDFPDGNAQKYEQVTGKLFPEGKLPEGWRVHIAGPAGNGWQVVNAVPSREQFETFAREQGRTGGIRSSAARSQQQAVTNRQAPGGQGDWTRRPAGRRYRK